jgi:hypothetical protein
MPLITDRKYRISGHEKFPCRYSWLPKAVRGLSANPKLFSNEEEAMVDLGVGKNMVRSIRFWSQSAGVVASLKNGGYSLTKFGIALLGQNGLDPFLEDIRTLWLIHWNLATDTQNPLLAWDFLLSRWQEPELVRSTVLSALAREGAKSVDKLSVVTLEQHFDTFIHTYVPTRGRKGEVQEDNLDCPLVELELILKVGDRELESSVGKREPIYAFRREEKPDITPEVFSYCLYDFWQKRHGTESTLPLAEVAHGHGSPGRVFRLPEDDIRVRAEILERQRGGPFRYTESANLQQITRDVTVDPIELLKEIYSPELAHA